MERVREWVNWSGPQPPAPTMAIAIVFAEVERLRHDLDRSLATDAERVKDLVAAEGKARELDFSWMLDEWARLAPTLPADFAPNCTKILEIRIEKHKAALAPIKRDVKEQERQWGNLMEKIAALKARP
jgi:hypothetical protein